MMIQSIMNKLPLILMVSILALSSGGCNLFQQSQETSDAPPDAQSPTESSETPPPEQTFEESTPPTPSVATLPTYNLIPSTDPTQRRQEIQAGRANPFAIIPVKPVVTKKATTNGVDDPESLCKIEPQPTVATAQQPQAISNGGVLPPTEPVLPIPNEARGVLVSGVVKLRGTPVAIVKAPGESVARHVTAGATLSNGQVQVKSVNLNGGEPYVVLEQYGLDISRYVGEEPEETIEPPSPVTEVGTKEGSIAPPGPDGFGKVKNLVLLTLNFGEVVLGEEESNSRNAASGILCNSGLSPIKVEQLLLQVEDKTTGVVIDSFTVKLGNSYNLQSGQKAEFDGSIPKLRGRKQGDVNIKLVDWS